MIRRDEDRALTRLYEESGLFAKIIDAPAEIEKRQGEKTEIEAVRTVTRQEKPGATQHRAAPGIF